MKIRMKFFSIIGLLCASFPAFGIESKAKQAFLIDMTTNTVLFEKNANENMFPSSMTKMMTLYLLFERLHSGALKLTDTFRVSKKAWKTGGSKMFVQEGTYVDVENLVRGIATVSGNDACIVVTEGLFGSDEAGAVEMTKKARELGMRDTVFKNSTGLPDPEHITTSFDLAILGRRLIEDFPEFYHYVGEREFTYNGIKQKNRNESLSSNLVGVSIDGIKTGRTDLAGYGITLSAKEKDRRLLLVVNGYKTMKERTQDAEYLIKWGLREFDVYRFFRAGNIVTDAQVWLGNHPTVPLVTQEDVAITLPRNVYSRVKLEVIYTGPVEIPIQKGQKIGELIISAPNFLPKTVDLFAAHDVQKAPFFKRIPAAIYYLIWGKN